MKLLYIIILGLPSFISAQKKPGVNSTLAKPAQKKVIPKNTQHLASTTAQQAVGGFTITGAVTGFTDGTTVSFLNDQTGQPEKQTTIQGGKFVIKGKMDQPGFKGLIFANAEPLIPLFLDNSNIKISGDKDELNKVVISGSPSHTEFVEYSEKLKPYAQLFNTEGAEFDSVAISDVKTICEDFVTKYPSSYVAPLAIIRLCQASGDGLKAESLYNLLPQEVKESYLGTYARQQIQEAKVNSLGSVINEFSQQDTAGNSLSISSFRGKYVLIDFWASWCRPCRMENPNVVAAYNKYKDKSFTILGVSLDQAKPAWLEAIQMDNLAWSHVSDLKGWGNAVAAQFQVKSIPQNLLIDPQGRIIGKNLRGEVLSKKLSAILK